MSARFMYSKLNSSSTDISKFSPLSKNIVKINLQLLFTCKTQLSKIKDNSKEIF